MTTPLDRLLDIHRVRQYANGILRIRELAGAVWRDAQFVDVVRRAVLPLPTDARPKMVNPFPAEPSTAVSGPAVSGPAVSSPAGPAVSGPAGPAVSSPAESSPAVSGPAVSGPAVSGPAVSGWRVPPGRLAVVASGGSGATACLVGLARALEEAGRRPDVYSVSSGSALFGFPLAAGLSASAVADLLLGFRPRECADIAWRPLLAMPATLGRGFTGLLHGDRVESYFRRHPGERTLGDLPTPCYAPIWSVEHNRLEYLGPRTHPDVPVARAIRMAVSMPFVFAPVELDGEHWCDGGIVDILPVHPVLDIEPACETAIAVNVFHPPGFAGENATGWAAQRASILRAASQIRTSQHITLARENLTRLRAGCRTVLLEPVPYQAIRGAGFYRQFLDTAQWPKFMAAGHEATRQALAQMHASGAAGS